MISMERALNFGQNHLFKKEIVRNFIFVIASYVPKFCHKSDSQKPIETTQTSYFNLVKLESRRFSLNQLFMCIFIKISKN